MGARPINELTGIKKPSSVLVRGFSALEIAKQTGQIPAWADEAYFLNSLLGPRGYSNYELWTQIPGNEGKTLDDYWIFLGLGEAVANGLVLDQLALDVAALAMAAGAVEGATAALALAAAISTDTLAPKAAPIFTGMVNISEGLSLTGDATPIPLGANTDDWAPVGFAAASILRATTDATRELRGLAGGTDGRVVFLQNVGNQKLKLMNEAGSSLAANRFSIGADLILRPGQTVLLVYDPVSSRWRALRWNVPATALEVIIGADAEAYVTAKALADAGAFIVADAGEIAGSTWTPNMLLGINRNWTLTGNRIVGAPTGMIDGLSYCWKFKQDATGGRTLAFNAIFDFGDGNSAINTAANKVNRVFGTYDAAEGKIIANMHKAA